MSRSHCAGNLFGTIGPSPTATVFFGGTVITMDDRNTAADAVAIAGGKIVAVGAQDEVLARAGADARRVDLEGRTLMPGLIDPHQHPLPGGLMQAHTMSLSYDVYKTKAEVLDALGKKASQTPAGQWIYASYYDNILHGGYLTMAELDGVTTSHPTFVYYVSMHSATGNRLAFEASGIGPSVRELPGGGYFGVDAGGVQNGMIQEMPALMKFLGGFPKLTPALIAESMTAFLHGSAALGITMVHEAGAFAQTPEVFEGYKSIATHSPVRYSVSPMVDYLDQAMQFLAPYGKPGASALEIPGALLSFYAVKIVADGSPQQESAFQSQPYLNSADRGEANYTVDKLNELVMKVRNAGWPVSIHCNGDASLEMALDAIELAYGSSSAPPTGINRIEHCPQARPEQIARMKRLGVQPSHLMNNLYYYGAAYRDEIFGAQRAANVYPAGDFLASGIPFSIHSDCPCSPVAPLREIGTAVARVCSIDGSIIGAEQRVLIEAALKAMTVVAASHCGLGDKLGSLEVGKYADLTILEDDPRQVDPAKLGNVKVSQTWVNGQPIEIPNS
ncbi:MAG TPA: amidohydrolase [Candidatus Cybelea sp.]|nr:amidohydrolase [Candidatus Cybelea sp.]